MSIRILSTGLYCHIHVVTRWGGLFEQQLEAEPGTSDRTGAMGVRVAAWVLLLSILCMDIRVHARLRGRSAAVEPEVPDSVESDVHPLEKNEVKIPEQETPPKVVEPPKVPATPRQEVNRQALVVGGNGFIGSAVVEKLLLEGYQVTILNRNSTYFDIRERIITRVGHVLWDRSRPLRECTPLEVSNEKCAVLRPERQNRV